MGDKDCALFGVERVEGLQNQGALAGGREVFVGAGDGCVSGVGPD